MLCYGLASSCSCRPSGELPAWSSTKFWSQDLSIISTGTGCRAALQHSLTRGPRLHHVSLLETLQDLIKQLQLAPKRLRVAFWLAGKALRRCFPSAAWHASMKMRLRASCVERLSPGSPIPWATSSSSTMGASWLLCQTLSRSRTPSVWHRALTDKRQAGDNACPDRYTNSSTAVRYFLETLAELDAADKRRFLRFVTGSPALPPGGLAALQPRCPAYLF